MKKGNMSKIIPKSVIKLIVASVLFAFGMGVGQAQATTYYLTLNGTVGNGSSSNYDWSGTHYDAWSVQLSGLSSTTVNPGDEIIANINLDTAITLPVTSPSTGQPLILTWFDLGFYGNSFPNVVTRADNNSTVFSDNGTQVLSINNEITTSSAWLVNGVTFSPQNISFDNILVDFTISTQDPTMNNFANVTLDSAQIDYYLFSKSVPTVPEPGTMILFGFGMAGFAAYGRRRNKKA